jgi:hypothetical protein
MFLSEEDFSVHPCDLKVESIFKKLGIDKSKWYFGEAEQNYSRISVYYYNENMEDVSISFEFLESDNDNWVLESVDMSND